ncbi:potassium channel family protein [Spiribacter halobius]|uniref:Trk system potassium uptake protein TrkA n=1 Tax=Sediminicurvatus halobius TaxID=2182432 RepID=A0A2U2N7R0_9GAMM|nr:TrkA family potassium uptake protein [Spiribacter halobius]PWG65097.1 TrkA family potassium uptake protein [Spiribacter halobius]UEX78955.1 TrkA family potassium uptake protein [Spiribacter halobius]
MYLVIVGAGPVGNSLIELALEAGHDVVMVEPDAARAEHCADRHDVRVLAMDVAEDEFPEESGLEQADALIATTTDDSTNLMAVFLGRETGVATLASTVNHDSHVQLFRRLGVRVLADPERLVAQHLLDITLLPRTTDVTTLQDSEQVIELTLAPGSPLAGLTLEEIAERELLGPGLFIISVARKGKAFFPRHATRLEGGDQLIVFSRSAIRREDLDVFNGGRS